MGGRQTLSIYLLVIWYILLVIDTTHASPPASIKNALEWVSCGPSGLQCAQFHTRMDWTKAASSRINISVTRLPAEDPQRRIGSLIYNPGGPGVPASPLMNLVANGHPYFSPSLRQHFDIVGMDPRGVSPSTPIMCDPDIWNERVPYFFSNATMYRELGAHNVPLGKSCLRLTGPLLRFVDTHSVAFDLELLRLLLGNETLNFFGQSYGSQLGAAYAKFFPQHIRAMALDGIVDHAQPEIGNAVIESIAFEAAFDRFAEWCSQNPACPLYAQDIGQLFDSLGDAADALPIPAPACVASGECRANVTGEELRFNVQQHILYKDPVSGTNGWLDLAERLAEARAGNASRLSTKLAQSTTDNIFARQAIYCLDYPPADYGSSAYIDKQNLVRSFAPHTKAASQSFSLQAGCLGWPVPATNPPKIINVTGTPPILLTSSKYDPLTPQAWAEGLLNQIQNAVLVTRNGDGHGSYVLNGATAAAIDAYLVNLTVPAANTVYQT